MKKLVDQILKFGFVGVIATLIDWSIYYICIKFLGIDYKIANVLGFCISVIFNYTASVKYVFDVDKNKDPKRNFVIFMTFSIIGLILNEALLILCVSKLHFGEMISKIGVSIIVMTFNFVTRKKFLEENKNRR